MPWIRRRKAAELRSCTVVISVLCCRRARVMRHTGCAEKRIRSLEKTAPQTMAAICVVR